MGAAMHAHAGNARIHKQYVCVHAYAGNARIHTQYICVQARTGRSGKEAEGGRGGEMREASRHASVQVRGHARRHTVGECIAHQVSISPKFKKACQPKPQI
jgi:hypothetical protein